MNFKLFFYLLIFTLIFSCQSEKEKLADQTSQRNSKIDSTISSFEHHFLKNNIDSVFSKYNFNGSVAVFKNENKIYEKSNGFENFKEKIKLHTNSVFAIASISKQFTAVLILLHEDLGKLSTEDKVSKYLTEFQIKPFENITIRQLLNHTSGISDFGNGLISKPGEKLNYSNKGFYFLGKVVEKVSGKSFDENAKELFNKLKMHQSSTANIFNENHFASAYLGNATKFKMVENMPKRLSNKEISVPAGGILSTTNDLNLWNQALYNGGILKQQTFNKYSQKYSEMNHPILGELNYGFGIMVDTKKSKSFLHSGYVKGSPGLNIYYPETKMSVIILSNIADESKGKSSNFQPHKEVKKITDSLQIAVVELRNKMESEPIL